MKKQRRKDTNVRIRPAIPYKLIEVTIPTPASHRTFSLNPILTIMSIIPNRMTQGVRGIFNRLRDDGEYLFKVHFPNSTSRYPDRYELSDDDTNSITSHSTNSTVDDNPGTGRLMDKFLYQALGRKLERVIFRIRIRSLPPARISGYFEEITGLGSDCIYRAHLDDLRDCVNCFHKGEHTQSAIYGLKCLVKQTQLAAHIKIYSADN